MGRTRPAQPVFTAAAADTGAAAGVDTSDGDACENVTACTQRALAASGQSGSCGARRAGPSPCGRLEGRAGGTGRAQTELRARPGLRPGDAPRLTVARHTPARPRSGGTSRGVSLPAEEELAPPSAGLRVRRGLPGHPSPRACLDAGSVSRPRDKVRSPWCPARPRGSSGGAGALVPEAGAAHGPPRAVTHRGRRPRLPTLCAQFKQVTSSVCSVQRRKHIWV